MGIVISLVDHHQQELLCSGRDFQQDLGAMNPSPVKMLARQVALWSSLVLVVVLSSLLFSLLGTLCTAVAGGLIMGASRRWKWQAIPVSAVFPLAGLTLAQAAKADLDARQRFVAAAVSFGAFWGTYVLTLILLLMEKKEEPSALGATKLDRAASANDGVLPEQERNGRLPSSAGRALETSVSNEPISLRDLQGTWLCETNGAAGQAVKRRLEIAEDTFALNITTSDGGTRLAAQGAVKLEGVDGATKLVLAAKPAREPNSLR